MYSLSAQDVFYFVFDFQSTLATSGLRHVASAHRFGAAGPTLFISPGENLQLALCGMSWHILCNSTLYVIPSKYSGLWLCTKIVSRLSCYVSPRANRRVPLKTSHSFSAADRRDSQLTIYAS